MDILNDFEIVCEYFSETTTQERRDELKNSGECEFGSYIIGDNDGQIYKNLKDKLAQSPFKVKTINLIEPKLSTPYNPLSPQYLETDTDIIRLASIIVDSAIGKNDPVKPHLRAGMKSLLSALIAYLTSEMSRSDRNLCAAIEMLKQFKRGDGYEVTPADVMFNHVKESSPKSLAARQYDIYANSDWDDLNFISDHLLKLLYLYENEDISSIITAEDKIDIKSFTEIPSVLFFIIPACERTYVPFTQMAYDQFVNILTRQRFRGQGTLPVFYIDD